MAPLNYGHAGNEVAEGSTRTPHQESATLASRTSTRARRQHQTGEKPLGKGVQADPSMGPRPQGLGDGRSTHEPAATHTQQGAADDQGRGSGVDGERRTGAVPVPPNEISSRVPRAKPVMNHLQIWIECDGVSGQKRPDRVVGFLS